MRHITHLIVPEFEGERTLLMDRAGGWGLPVVEAGSHWDGVASINAAVREKLELTATLLLCAGLLRMGGGVTETVCVMECHEPLWRPPAGARWVARDELAALEIADAGERRALERWFGERDGGVPDLRPEWQRRGWYADAVRWGERQLAALRRPATGPAEQMRQWSITSVLRFPTGDGAAWLKAVPGYMAQEAALTQLVESVLPGQVPHVLVADDERGWTLMDHFEATTLRDLGNPPGLGADALRLLARLQIAFVDRTDELLAIGCRDARLRGLARDFAAMVARDDATESLSAAERARVRAFGEELPERTAALAACGIPETLIHGDFHHGNVGVQPDGQLLIFDWTDGCVSHPFFDLATFYPDFEGPRDALREAYLDVWRERYPASAVAEAARLAEPLAHAHHALNYRRIVDAAEPATRWEFGGEEWEWFRRLLAAVGD